MISLYRKNLINAALAILTAITVTACNSNNFTDSSSRIGVTANEKGPQIEKPNWEPAVYAGLDNMINTYGINSPDYNPQRKPYAVFDWDNTSIINDIEETTFLYQLRSLNFKMTPDKFAEVILKDIPKNDFSKEFCNEDKKPFNIDLIADDISSDYKYLYDNCEGFKGDKPLSEIKKTPQYNDFVAKLRFLYDAIGGTFSSDVSYPWVTYFFTGMTAEEVTGLARETIEHNKSKPMQMEALRSPSELPGKAGVVSIKYYTGIRATPEMRNLYNTLMKNGFDVYVCSASFIDLVKYFASNPKNGFNVPEANIMAMELERDRNGVIVDKYRLYYDQTQGKGKTKNIERFLVSKYGYGPTLVAGDSSSDYAMLTDFKDMKLGLIFNRCKGGDIGELCKKAIQTKGQKDQKYFLQGRDENKGILIPETGSILYGTIEPQVSK